MNDITAYLNHSTPSQLASPAQSSRKAKISIANAGSQAQSLPLESILDFSLIV
jgi:hypothetical protein